MKANAESIVAALLCVTVAALLVPGCATSRTVVVDGKEVQRLDLTLTGQPYTVRHVGAYPAPGSPSGGLRADGGAISGTVCGMRLDYEVYHRGDHVQLVGMVDGSLDSQLRIEEPRRLGFHRITGSLGTRAVGLQIFADRIIGFVGAMGFEGRPAIDLRKRGDGLEQTYFARVVARGNEMHVRVNGLSALWQMSAAAQGAIVPLLAACIDQFTHVDFGRDLPVFGFGGPAQALPPNTVVLDQSLPR